MKSESKASLLKWAPLTIGFLALIPAYLMGPIAFTFKATVRDMMREELVTHETKAGSEIKWKAQQDRDNEFLKRLDQDLVMVRDRAALSESNHARQLIEFDNRLTSLETQLRRLKMEYESNGKRQSDTSGP
jgi:hypothetical protein